MNRILAIFILLGIAEVGQAQEDVTRRMDSLLIIRESYCYVGDGKFDGWRSCRMSCIGVQFASAVLNKRDSVLTIHGTTIDEIRPDNPPFANLEILVGDFQEYADSASFRHARLQTRLKFSVDSLANFSASFRFYPTESLCFTMSEPVDNADTASIELAHVKIYQIGELIK
jgi:hypothetical protein